MYCIFAGNSFQRKRILHKLLNCVSNASLIPPQQSITSHEDRPADSETQASRNSKVLWEACHKEMSCWCLCTPWSQPCRHRIGPGLDRINADNFDIIILDPWTWAAKGEICLWMHVRFIEWWQSQFYPIIVLPVCSGQQVGCPRLWFEEPTPRSLSWTSSDPWNSADPTYGCLQIDFWQPMALRGIAGIILMRKLCRWPARVP